MSPKRPEETPAGVPETAKQAGETESRWRWVEPAAWTERMLTALEDGVKGGKWFSLIDKVVSVRVLRASFARVKRNRGAPGVDHVTIERFEGRLEEELERLSASLRAESYRPQAIRRVWIEKPGRREKRPLGIPTVRDRVVQGALRLLLEPIFEAEFADTSFGFRPGRSGHDALRRVVEHLDSGFTWVVDADLRRFFDTMDHGVLMTRLRERVSDGRILSLIEAFLRQDVMEGIERWTPEAGSPQGAVLSPLLSNVFLDPLDHRLARKGFAMVRYADDFVVLCRSRAEAERALGQVRGWVEEVGLTLHPEKTRIVDASRKGGFDFLGYHFERGHSWPSKKSLQRFKATIRRQTKRTNGYSLEMILSLVNRRTRGWYQYFRYSPGGTFRDLDGWIRMRLRSILRKRHHGRGRGRGRDHQRWPNAFFAERGLLSLLAAYEEAGRPSWR